MEYNKPLYTDVKRGEIYYISTDDNSEAVGSEQCNHDRPGIIVSNDVGNIHSGVVEVVYLTTQPKKNLPTHVEIYTTQKPSTALCEQICTISKFRLRKYVNQCSNREMEDIDNALIISLQLSKAKGVVKYMEKWDKMLKEEIELKEEIKLKEELGMEIPTEVSSPTIPVESCGNNIFSDKDVAYIATLETQLELYKKFYEDTHRLLELAIGGK